MGRDFVGKTLSEITIAIQGSVFASRDARKTGFLQLIDPRIKLITTLSFLIVIGLTNNIKSLFIFYMMTLVLAILSRLPLVSFVKRVWIFIPLFTGIIALPAVFNIITPGKTLLTVMTLSSPYTFGPFHIPQQITITAQGVAGAALLVLRVATSISMAILLVLTTEWTRLLKALSVLKVPEVAILIFAITYRYIQLFLRTLEGMLLAKKSRQISDARRKEDYSWIASRLGVLVGKSYQLSSEVHLAMVARGWSGNPTLMDDFSLGLSDLLWVLTTVAVIMAWVMLK